MKSTARLTGTIAAILGSTVLIAAPIANADSADDAFLHALSAQGITWPNGEDKTVVNVGHGVCTDWANGMTLQQTFADVKTLQLSDTNSGYLIGAATQAYCPQYMSKAQQS
jgi:uncharacterized protein DUF732